MDLLLYHFSKLLSVTSSISNVGDYYVPLGQADGANVAFTYDLTMTFQTISPARGVIVTEEVTYNYVIIQ